jgi:hypothetical protein
MAVPLDGRPRASQSSPRPMDGGGLSHYVLTFEALEGERPIWI